eukprot:2994242-Pleurochrysis_carterae.AAC.1
MQGAQGAKIRRPTHINNWQTRAVRRLVTCRDGNELEKWRAAQVELDELGWSAVLPALIYVVQHSADPDWEPSGRPGRPSKE